MTSPQPSSHLTRGYVICLAGTALWSTTGIFIRYLSQTYHLPALVLAFWRDLSVTLALAIAFILFRQARRRLERHHLFFLVVYGLVTAVFNSLWTVSVALNGAAVATVLAYSSAAFTALLGWQLFGEPLVAAKLLAVALALLGCVLASGAYDAAVWQLNFLGILTGLLSGLAFAAYSLMGKSASRRGINPWSTLLYIFAFATLFILTFDLTGGWMPKEMASPNLLWLGKNWVGWGVLIALGVGPTIGGFGFYTVSLTYLPASVANLIATLEPAMTAGLAYLFLGERLTAPQLFGSGLIIAGVVVLRLSEGAKS